MSSPWKNRSFAFKLNLMFLAAFFGVFVISIIILGFKWTHLLNQGLTARGTLSVQNARAQVNFIIDTAETVGRIYSYQLGEAQEGSREEQLSGINGLIEHATAPMLKQSPLISGIAIVLLDGEGSDGPSMHHYQYDPQAGNGAVPMTRFHVRHYMQLGWYDRLLREQKPFWHYSQLVDNGASPSCLYVTPITDSRTGAITTALIIEVSDSLLQREIDKVRLESSGACFLYFNDGRVIAKSQGISRNQEQTEREFRSNLDFTGSSPFPAEKARQVHLNASDRGNEGGDVFYVRCRDGWGVSLIIPGDWVGARLWTLFRYVCGVFMVTVPLVIFISYVVTKRITEPLTRLTKAAEAIGGGRFNITLPAYRGNDEIAQLTRSFEQMQRELAIYTQELKKSFRQQEHMESELNIAKTIQMGILPKVESAFSDLGQFDLEAILIPAKGVGGDLYDFFFLDEHNLALIVGDVSGKGIPAALFMSVTQSLQRSISFRFKKPAEIVTQLNKLLMMGNEASMFVTYFIGVINTCTGEMSYCNAGHNFPYIRRSSGELDVIGSQHGLPLGFFEQTYTCDEVTLGENDTLILYTDGITEAFNPRNELFGEIRLKEAIAYAMSSDPRKIVATILSHLNIFVEDYEQSDDITLLALQMKSTVCPVDETSPEEQA